MRPVGLVLATCALVSCVGAPQTATPSPVPTEDPRVAELQSDLEWTRQQLATVQADLRAARTKADQVQCCGTFPMWTGRPEALSPARYGVSGVPDTFTFHLRFSSDQPVRARIMTFAQFVDLMSGRPVNTPHSWGPTTSLNVDFHEAEGCAFYVLVLDVQRETVFRPDIWMTLNPSAEATGACR